MLANANPQYFYDILPYAVALGVADTWAQKFAHMVLRPPAWYTGGSPVSTFSASSFASEFSKFADSFCLIERGGDSGGGSWWWPYAA